MYPMQFQFHIHIQIQCNVKWAQPKNVSFWSHWTDLCFPGREAIDSGIEESKYSGAVWKQMTLFSCLFGKVIGMAIHPLNNNLFHDFSHQDNHTWQTTWVHIIYHHKHSTAKPADSKTKEEHQVGRGRLAHRGTTPT